MGWRFLLAIGVLVLGGCAGAPPAGGGRAMIGRPAPRWSGLDWTGGRKLRLKDFKGRPVVLHWWTDGCPPCVVSVAAMNRLFEQYSRQGLGVIGVYYPDPKREVGEEDLKEVAMLLGIQFPLAVDEDWSALGRYWVRTVGRPPVAPAFFIDARGNVRAIFSGETMTESDASKMETLVVELIREARTPPPTATP